MIIQLGELLDPLLHVCNTSEGTKVVNRQFFPVPYLVWSFSIDALRGNRFSMKAAVITTSPQNQFGIDMSLSMDRAMPSTD
jgi:hypothetical protein